MSENQEAAILRAILSGVYYCIKEGNENEAIEILDKFFRDKEQKPKVSKETIERIRNEIDLATMIIMGRQLDQKTYWSGDCPFCENGKDELIVLNDRYMCGNCDAEGDAIQWCMLHYGMTFNETIEYLTKRLED